jgi:trans-2,3-dihydro-3-hydroxyanthranilate isomerase
MRDKGQELEDNPHYSRRLYRGFGAIVVASLAVRHHHIPHDVRRSLVFTSSRSGGCGTRTEVALDLKVGRIPVSFKAAPDGLFGEMTQRDPEFGKIHNPDEIARATGIPPSELDTSIPIQTVSTGFAFAIVPLRSLATLGKLQIDLAKAYEYLATTDARQFYFITRDTNGEAGLRARMFFYGGEDPATGSAAGCTAAWMVRLAVAKSDEQVILAQGIEMKRPSRIFVRASIDGARVHNVRVGGYCAEVMRGELMLPDVARSCES